MTDKEILRELMRINSITSSALAKKSGYKTPSGITEKFRRKGSMHIDTFVKILTALDSTLIVRHGETEYKVFFDDEK